LVVVGVLPDYCCRQTCRLLSCSHDAVRQPLSILSTTLLLSTRRYFVVRYFVSYFCHYIVVFAYLLTSLSTEQLVFHWGVLLYSLDKPDLCCCCSRFVGMMASIKRTNSQNQASHPTPIRVSSDRVFVTSYHVKKFSHSSRDNLREERVEEKEEMSFQRVINSIHVL